jgi:YD repeat-containing protein
MDQDRQTVGASTSTYAYPTTSNRLTQVGALARTYDADGSTLSDGANTFTYDARERLVRAVSAAGATDYKVNAMGQRIRKTGAQGDTLYHYDTQGRLIAETSATTGAIQKEYIYLGDIPVAVIDASIAGSTTATAPAQPSYTARAGTAVTLTVNVAGNAPTGTVTFREGTTVLGTASVSNGAASLTLMNLAVGQHTISAGYSGDARNAVSTATLQVTIQPDLSWLPPILQFLLD